MSKDQPTLEWPGKQAITSPPKMESGGGLITLQDLADYEAIWREPIAFSYRGYQLYSMPPSSSGGVAQALIFNVLEGTPELAPFGSSELLQHEVEAMRWAFVDRNEYLGDPAFVDMPLDRLLSAAHASEVRNRFVAGEAGD